MPVGTSWNLRTDVGPMGTYRNILMFLMYFYCADSEKLAEPLVPGWTRGAHVSSYGVAQFKLIFCESAWWMCPQDL